MTAQLNAQVFKRPKIQESLYVSGKLPPYPSPKPTFRVLMLAYGRGRWAVSQKRIQIHPVPCEPSLLTASPKALLGSFSNDDDDGDSDNSTKKKEWV